MKYLERMKKRTSPPTTHSDIIVAAGGPSALGRKIGVDPNTTKAWKRLNSIPAPHWKAVADAGIASLEDLASAAAAKAAQAAAA